MVDTAPLPPVGPPHAEPAGDDAPTERLAPVGSGSLAPTGSFPVAPSPALRGVEIVAGLLSGGLLMLGLALLVLQFLAPDLAPGTGLAAAGGPGWARVGVQLGVGVAGELTVLARRRTSSPVRWVMAVAVIVLVLAALWWAWWA
jgi:hypothetical protein